MPRATRSGASSMATAKPSTNSIPTETTVISAVTQKAFHQMDEVSTVA